MSLRLTLVTEASLDVLDRGLPSQPPLRPVMSWSVVLHVTARDPVKQSPSPFIFLIYLAFVQLYCFFRGAALEFYLAPFLSGPFLSFSSFSSLYWTVSKR